MNKGVGLSNMRYFLDKCKNITKKAYKNPIDIMVNDEKM